MNLYLISARGDVGYDSYSGHVVRAWTDHDARRVVPKGDECGWRRDRPDSDFWTNDETSSCVLVGTTVTPGGDLAESDETTVLLSSFHAG